MKNKILIITTIFSIACGCTSTTIDSSWKIPNESFTKDQLNKILVVALVKNDSIRKIAEDKLTLLNPAFRSSYLVLGNNLKSVNDSIIKNIIAKEGFDGVVSMQLVNEKKNPSYLTGNNQGGYYGWHQMYYNDYYRPGNYTEDEDYFIETNLFSIKEDKLIWSGVTSTLNPTNISNTVEEVWHAVYQRMRKDKLIVHSPKK